MTLLSREAIAYQSIKQRIIDAEFKPNTLVSENELAVSLNMSRTPVRSALSQLSIEGFVRTYRNKGVLIVEISLQEIVNIFEVLSALQLQVMDLALAKDLVFDLKALKDHLAEQETAAENKNFKSYYTHTLLFTRTILMAANNDKMLEIIDSYTGKILAKLIANRKYRNNNKPQITNRTQGEIYRALAARDFETAKTQIRHYNKIMKEYAFRQEISVE